MSDNTLTLFELNNLVRRLVEDSLDSTFRVKAELSEVRLSARGHCFVELVEKDAPTGRTVAKARGIIMASVFPLLKMDFEETTGQAFAAGLQVLLEVRPTFSEVYGYSLVVTDIDATYTLGDMVRRRREILLRLEREGVLEMNRSLTLPDIISRIAVISSPTAAGYGDFCRQLDDNGYGFRFHYRLFPALMQGEETARSVIAAFDRIAAEADRWDAVVIIRGGGAVSDLGGFESYELANSVAQFPLPVLTGIGHERDTTVLDFVANVHLKTPTAVAAFLIDRMSAVAAALEEAVERLRHAVEGVIAREQQRLERARISVDHCRRSFIAEQRLRIGHLSERLRTASSHLFRSGRDSLDLRLRRLKVSARSLIQIQRQRIDSLRRSVDLSDPKHVLRQGYSMTFHEGHIVSDSSRLKKGDTVETRLRKGSFKSKVE